MAIGKRPDAKRAGHQAEEAGRKQRTESRDRQTPFDSNRWCDEADERGIEAVDRDDEKAQNQETLLES